MEKRYFMFRRRDVYYCQDNVTQKQTSLRTKDKAHAERLLHAKNEAALQPARNFQIAQVYLQHSDPTFAARTWDQTIDHIINTKTGATSHRWQVARKDPAFDSLRDRKLIQTTAEHFLQVLRAGGVSTNVYLRALHNYAMGMHWLPWPVLPKLQWPAVQYRERRAITPDEHQRIIEREQNPATRAYYQLLWHLGGSQSDIAALTAENVDWQDRTINYERAKTGVMSHIAFGAEVAAILKSLPSKGLLFPALARIRDCHRAKLFTKRLQSVGITGVSLHSYRYAWAERAKEAGYPERFAMQALGHSSKAVHRAYARKAHVTVPPLEDYEKRRHSTPMLPQPSIDAGRN